MERNGAFSTAEVVGIAAAASVALGGLVTALARSHDRGRRTRIEQLRDVSLGDLLDAVEQRSPQTAWDLAERISAALPDMRQAVVVGVSRAPELHGSQAARDFVERIAAAYPEIRREVVQGATRASEGLRDRRARVSDVVEATLATIDTDELRLAAEAALKRAEDLRESVATTRRGKRSELPSMAAAAIEAVQPKRKEGKLRDTITSLGTIALASGVAYLALSSRERREKIKDGLCRLLDRVQTLSDDFRGYDEGYEA